MVNDGKTVTEHKRAKINLDCQGNIVQFGADDAAIADDVGAVHAVGDGGGIAVR